MADNLTLKFKQALEDRGVAATDDEVSKFLTDKGLIRKTSSKAGVMPGVVGASGGQPAFTPTLMTRTIKPPASPEQQLYDFVGSTLWHGTSSALLGIPEIIAEKYREEGAPYQWGEMSAGGNVGAVLGEAAGFLLPLAGISAGTKGAVSAFRGTKHIIGRTAKQVADKAAGRVGIEADVAEGIFRKTLADPRNKRELLPAYSAGRAELDVANKQLAGQLDDSFRRAFPNASGPDREKIIRSAMDGLASDDVHVNEISRYIAKSLNTNFDLDDANKITQYVGRAAEMTVNFGIYNTVANGIQAIAGRQDFDPVGNIYHAFMFSSLLPAVEMIPGGGRIKMIAGSKRLRKLLDKFPNITNRNKPNYNKNYYDNMTEETAVGLAKLFEKDASLMGKEMGDVISTWVRSKDMSKDSAVRLLKKAHALIKPAEVWSAFRREAGKDFFTAIPRMMAGAFYFNAQTLLDYNLLQNMDPEVLGAHLLTGAFFTKMHKPLFPKERPYIYNMEHTERALQYFGINAQGIEILASSIRGPNHVGHINAGMIGREDVGRIVDVFNKPEYQRDTAEGKDPVGTEGVGNANYNLVRWAFRIFNRHQAAKEAKEDKPRIDVDLKLLSASELKDITNELKKIEFTDKEGKTQKLDTENFHEWADQMDKEIHHGQMTWYLKTLIDVARELGVRVDGDAKSDSYDWKAHDFEQTIGISKIEGIQEYLDKGGEFGAIATFHQMRDILIDIGLVHEISERHTPVNVNTLRDLGKKELGKLIDSTKERIDRMTEKLHEENYGDKDGKPVGVEIDPIDNGFLQSMYHWRHRKALNDTYSIVQNHNLTEAEGILRDKLRDHFGDTVPHRLEEIVSMIQIKRGDKTKQEWQDILLEKGEDSLIGLTDKLKNLAQIWGTNKSSGKLKDHGKGAGVFDYSTAKEIVKTFENAGWRLQGESGRRFTERVGQHFWRRYLESANVSATTKAVIDVFRHHGLAEFEGEVGRNILKFPGRDMIVTLLEEARIDGKLLEGESTEILKKYDFLRAELRGVSGKFIQFPNKMDLKHSAETQLATLTGAIREAYGFTKDFHKDVTSHFKDLQGINEGHKQWIADVHTLLGRMFDMETADGRPELKVEFDLASNKTNTNRELGSMRKELRKLIKIGETSEWTKPADVKNLEGLLESLGRFELEGAGTAVSIANAIKNMIDIEANKITKVQELVHTVVFDMANYSSDRIMGKVRLDKAVADLMGILEKEGIDLKDIEGNPTLSNIAGKFAKNSRKGLDTFITRMQLRQRAWKRSWSEEEFIKEQESLRVEMEDGTSGPMSNSKWSAEYIQKEYSNYNTFFEREAWETKQQELVDERNFLNEILKKYPGVGKKGKTYQTQREVVDRINREILVEAKNAIVEKYERAILSDKKDRKKSDDIAALHRNLDVFLQAIFPHFLSRSIGTESVRVAELSFGADGNPILYWGKGTQGKGALTEFFSELTDAGINIAKLSHTGTYKNRKVDINTIKDNMEFSNIDRIIERSIGGDKPDIHKSLIDNEVGADFTEAGEKVFKSARVITSYNTSLVIGTDNLHETKVFEKGTTERGIEGDGKERGVLNHHFNLWYQNKKKILGNILARHSHEKSSGQYKRAETVLANLKQLYGSYLNQKNPTANRARHMIRAMYWDNISSVGFENMVNALGTKSKLQKQGADMFKYFSLAEGSGSKLQGSEQFLSEMLRIDKDYRTEVIKEESPFYKLGEEYEYKYGFMTEGQKESANYYIDKGKFEMLVLKDEGSVEGGNAFLNEGILKNHIQEKIDRGAYGAEGTISRKNAENMLKNAGKELWSLLEGSSSINAHTWLGTHAARITYMHRGRHLNDGEFPEYTGIPHTAGVKPSGWVNKPDFSLLMKTNFAFDAKVAKILDKLGIDMITTESATKMRDDSKKMLELTQDNYDRVAGLTKEAKDKQRSPEFSELLEDMVGDLKTGRESSFITSENVTDLKLENLFIGKTEDRKGITNVTYALSDFLHTDGMQAFLGEYVNYGSKLRDAVGKVQELAADGGRRQAVAEFMLQTMREEGVLLEGSSNSLTSDLLQQGADPASALIRDNIQRLAHKWMIKELRKPTTEGASYSILMPFLEGSLPVYTKVGEVKTQTVFGGKKLPYADSEIIIKDWDSVKYVVSVETENFGRRDIQIGKKGERWEIDDPFEQHGQYSKKEKQKLTNKEKSGLVDQYIKIIEGLQKEVSDTHKTSSKYIHIFDKLQLFNRDMESKMKTELNSEYDTIHLHSLSLRMPNLGGDVAIHKVEGFWGSEQSNVVGVNIVDLASIHQADFDVDALFSYHDAPYDIAKSAWKTSGLAPDAKTYTKDAVHDVDPFGTGAEAGVAGSKSQNTDSMQPHMENYLKSKDNFGRVKRLSSGIAALQRLEASLSFKNSSGSSIFSDILGLNGRKRLNTKGEYVFGEGQEGEVQHWGGFLQRYKNVLQTLIDATKKPNFLSNAKFEDVAKFILFGEKGELSESALKRVLRDRTKYGEESWKPLFDFSNMKEGREKEVMQDIVLESINMLGRSTRILSDVFDDAGRRTPEPIEIMQMKNRLRDFTNDPNGFVFRQLLAKYKSDKGKQLALINTFFKTEGYKDLADLREKLTKANLKWDESTQVTLTPLYIKSGSKKIEESSIGNYIAQNYTNSTSAALGYSRRLNKNESVKAQVYDKLLRDIDSASAVFGEESENRKLWEFIETEDALGNAFHERIKETATFYESKADGSGYKIGDNKKKIQRVQDYSIMYHMLENSRDGLQRFVARGSKGHVSSAVLSARRRIISINTVLDYLKQQETGMIESFKTEHRKVVGDVDGKYTSKDNLYNHFMFNDYNLTRAPKKDKFGNVKKTPATNTTGNMLYVYKAIKSKDGNIRYQKQGYIAPTKTAYLRNGGDYVILKNPIKWTPMDKVEVLDGYAMMHVTGRVRADHVVGYESMQEFTFDANNLRSDLGALSRETFEISKRGNEGAENWMIESAMEDKLVNVFMKKWIDRNSNILESEDGRISRDLMDKQIFSLAGYLMKPEVAFGDVAYTRGGMDVALPSFKINRRLTNATFRWLKKNHPEMFGEIALEYGRNFRMRYNNVMPSEVSNMHTSMLFHRTGETKPRSEMLDLLFDRQIDLYSPEIFHVVRAELAGYKTRTFGKFDQDGELVLMDRYGTYGDLSSMLGLYKDPHTFIREELGVENYNKSSADCGG